MEVSLIIGTTVEAKILATFIGTGRVWARLLGRLVEGGRVVGRKRETTVS